MTWLGPCTSMPCRRLLPHCLKYVSPADGLSPRHQTQGGVIRKKPEWRVRFKAFLLAIEDPNVQGHDIASGTYQIQRVRPCMP